MENCGSGNPLLAKSARSGAPQFVCTSLSAVEKVEILLLTLDAIPFGKNGRRRIAIQLKYEVCRLLSGIGKNLM
jgi:hypothetical protein